MAMPTQVLIAHTGQRLQVNVSQFASYVLRALFCDIPLSQVDGN